eukprot:7385298-Prymnesium_polylepis.1
MCRLVGSAREAHRSSCTGALYGTLPTWPEDCMNSVARVLSPLSHVPPDSRNVFTAVTRFTAHHPSQTPPPLTVPCEGSV